MPRNVFRLAFSLLAGKGRQNDGLEEGKGGHTRSK